MADNDLIRNKGIMSAAQTMWTIDFDSEQSLEIGKVQNQKFTGKCWIYAGLNLLRILANRKNSRTSIILSANYIAYYDKYEKSKYFWLNHKFCGISDSSRSSVGSYRIASERNIRHQDIRIPVCEES